MTSRLTHTPLNSAEIQDKIGDLQFIPYEELPEISDVDELLPQSLILYQLAKTGHFVCVFENSEGINFFDPLGYSPDAELNVPIEPHLRYQKHENFTHMLRLLSQADHVVWNEHRYQMKGTSTCGHWCTIRLLCSKLTNDEFWRVWQRIPNRDRIVALLYQSI